jgi:HAMP domain-containing protein
MIGFMIRARKKILLVNRDFQLRYSYAAVAVGFLSSVVSAVVLLFPLYQFEILRIPNFLPLPVMLGMGVAVLVNIGIVALLGLFITHRIAGPMYSLVRAFRRVELGLWAGHMRLRKDDDLKYVVRNFNQMVDGLVQTGRTDVDRISSVLDDIETGRIPEASRKAAELKEIISGRLLDIPIEGIPANGKHPISR